MYIASRTGIPVLKTLGVESRVRILELLQNQELNVNEIARRLHIPQSTAATGILALEKAGLVDSHSAGGVKGGQKKCIAAYKELVIAFNPPIIEEESP